MVYMEDYNNFSDEKLQELASAGDSHAENILVARYSGLVESSVRSHFLVGGESADLSQEGMVGLLSAIREYRESSGVPFKAYASLCIRRRILSAVRYASRMKHIPLNQGVSFEETMSDSSHKAADRLAIDQRRVPEEQVLARESDTEFFQSFSRFLSPLEHEVLCLCLDGYSYRSIAQRLGKNEKAVDNAVQRIRRKLARILSSGDISES